MKKLVLSLTLIAGLSTAVNAQKGGAVRKLSIGADIGLPTDNGSKNLMLAGGSVYYEHPVAKSVNLTGSIGYLSLFSTSKGNQGNIGFTSLKVGGKYYFAGNFYGAGEVGATIQREGGRGFFAITPSLGTSFSITDKSSLDLGLRYENWSKDGNSFGFVGLRAAYAFGS
ncbi:MAG: hypothetical protein WC622_05035 [Pedobacter sp.]|jgi:hypothetical protein|uniref:hypothetical protein n=1 Tax=Pedobacter sp. TaxID=1411316 RepID=UPI0035660B97